jgi:hypothetical protein
MKRLFLILLIAVLPLISKSQPLFGYTPSQIRDKWPNFDWEYEKWGERKDKMIMTFAEDDIRVMYFFDENNHSVFTSICPLTIGELQGMIEQYNNRYVVVDNTTWRFYNDGAVFLCTLRQTADTKKYYFLWTVEE